MPWGRPPQQGWPAPSRATAPLRGAQRPVCWACPAAWGCKSPVQPDGGEARVKRKGGTGRDRLKEAWSEIATRRTEIGSEAELAGRAGRKSQSPYPSRTRAVNPAGVRGRLWGLPQEICIVSPRGTWGTEDAVRRPDRDAEVSRGHSRSACRLKARTVPDEGLKERASSSDVS